MCQTLPDSLRDVQPAEGRDDLVQPARLELALLDPQVARELGVADLDDNGEWVVGDLSRLDGD
jgi:hypothetical protein